MLRKLVEIEGSKIAEWEMSEKSSEALCLVQDRGVTDTSRRRVTGAAIRGQNKSIRCRRLNN